MKEHLRTIINSIMDLIFPLDEACVLCDKEIKLQPPYLCEGCLSKLEPMPFAHNSDIPVYTRVLSGYLLNDLAKKMIYSHKYDHKRYLSHTLAHLLAKKIRESGIEFDEITCIPSGKKRNRMRGCDHAYDIAYEVGKILNKPVVKMLKRVHHEAAQVGLTRLERYENMALAFEVIEEPKANISVLIIDDIYTTGATMIAAARCFKNENCKFFGATVFYTPIHK